MRVRISYSVELEEVPQEIIRLLEDGCEEIHRLKEKLIELCNDIENETTNAHRSKHQFSELRASLAKIDYCLADGDLILTGYYSAVNGAEEEDNVSEG
mgnify:FL=1